MSERAVEALPLGERRGVLADRRQDGVVAGEEVVFAEIEGAIAPVPNHHAILEREREIGRPHASCVFTDPRQVFAPPGGQQRQTVDGAPQVIPQRGAFERPARAIEDPG